MSITSVTAVAKFVYPNKKSLHIESNVVVVTAVKMIIIPVQSNDDECNAEKNMKTKSAVSSKCRPFPKLLCSVSRLDGSCPGILSLPFPRPE